MSSYPPPPVTAAGQALAGIQTTSPTQTVPPHPQGQTLQQYGGNGLLSPVSHNAPAAQHGLQALQVAAASPSQGQPQLPSPRGVQYAAAALSQVTQNYVTQAGDAATPGSAAAAQASAHAKATRLRRACDMCSQRKVKCDETRPECKPCRDLGVTCTFEREMKRRGPPNKHAEAARAAKQARVESKMTPSSHNAAEALVSIRDAAAGLDAEAIAPWEVLVLLVDDYFTYIHPLIPFPHEPTFRQQFANREDRTSPEFLALLASMIGCLVASFPRTARLHLKRQHSYNMFPRSVTLVDQCRTVALEARGHMWSDKEYMSVYDAACSYFLGLAAGYTMRWKMCRRFMAECMSLTRELGYHRANRASSTAAAMGMRHGNEEPTNLVNDEMGKRIFWVMLLGIRSMTQLGASHNELVLPPPTPPDFYPPLPAEVDDQYITPDRILPQPEGTLSLMTGFIKGIHIYMTMNPIVSVELSYGINSLGWEQQKDTFHNCLIAAKEVTNRLPRELTLNMDYQFGSSTEMVTPGPDFFENAPGYQYVPPAFPQMQPANDLRHIIENDPYKKRQLQYDIQKTNIYTSQLATRSYYVERYFTLRDTEMRSRQAQHHNAAIIYRTAADTSHLAASAMQQAASAMSPDNMDETDLAFMAERELIVQNLMTVLMSIPQRNMEPNGASLINKIRQVASTLLNDAPQRKGPLAMKAEQYLHKFLEILMRLEKTGSGSGSRVVGESGAGGVGDAVAMQTDVDEEEELRSWADLREHQAKFAQSGGFIGNL
ncbi:Zn 2cys6 transcription factor [Pleurostoma richardsiae]|uniref:Zn 2cys6 transcription factor n=1 Tax=Pleurostoma richardsiae TaxID=41990 RepID=A0AA38RRC4_9PEZI|nr:Zn 2cys6 transcription factor [Pleurostoma richardsiae]